MEWFKLLEGFYWLQELSEVEQAFHLNDLVIISLMKSHVLQKKKFFQELKEGSLLDPGTNCRVGQAVLSSNLIMSTVIIS